MKRFSVFLIALLLLSILLPGCQPVEEQAQAYKTRLLVINPSEWYLKSIVYLVENSIISIPDLQLQAVFYDRVKYRYEECRDYVDKNKLSFVQLKQVGGELNADNLFAKNPCSDTFYDLFRHSDGVLFLGGADIPPVVYGQKTSLLTGISTPYRHYFEASFLFHLLGGSQDTSFKPYLGEKPDYVVYGFCLGMQTLNVATGGTLHQDIPADVYGLSTFEEVLQLDADQQHHNYWVDLTAADGLNRHSFHHIQPVDGQFFTSRMNLQANDHPLVCSSHHQAAGQIGQNLVVAATTLDGKIVEALTHSRFPNVLGVQFHPEFLTLYDPESRKYRVTPQDSTALTEHETIVAGGSLQFHKNFWKYFSALFE